MSLSIMPIITKMKLNKPLLFCCNQRSKRIWSLAQVTASSAEVQKKYIPTINSAVYTIPGPIIHLQSLCCSINRLASRQDWNAITISLSKT